MVSGYQGFRVPGFQGFRVYISTSLTFLPCFAMPGGGAVRVTLMSLILLLLLLRRAFRVLGKPCAGHATRHINQNYLGNKLVIPPHTQHTELSLRSLLQVGVSKSAPLPHVVIPPTHSGPASSRLSTPTTCCHPPTHTQAQHPAGSAPLPHVVTTPHTQAQHPAGSAPLPHVVTPHTPRHSIQQAQHPYHMLLGLTHHLAQSQPQPHPTSHTIPSRDPITQPPPQPTLEAHTRRVSGAL